MKAMIFAAGMGTRLQPLTANKPKALVEVGGTPMLEIVIRKLILQGFNELIINVHHFAEQVVDFLNKNNNFGVSITVSDETDLLLDTGGGLKKAAWFFDDGKPFLVHNVDVLSNIDLQFLLHYHVCQPEALATLAVKDRFTSRSLLISDEGYLTGWRNNKTGETKISRPNQSPIPIAFHGIQIISPAMLPLIDEQGVFSLTNVYLRLAQHYLINTYRNDNDIWMDLGSIENLKKAELYLKM